MGGTMKQREANSSGWGVGQFARACAVAACALLVAGAGGCAGGKRGASMAEATPEQRAAQSFELAKRAQAAYAKGDLDASISLYRDSVMTNPDFGAAWHNLALALTQRKGDSDFVAAADAYKRALALLPSDPTPVRNLAMLYAERGWGEDALQYVQRALDIDPNDRDSLRLLAKVGRDLRTATPLHLDMLRRGQLAEADPNWEKLFAKERIRVENDLRERRKEGVLSGT
jgi:tetratricopeptide (TPR) repeat protein